ncbi:hypothetical protein DPMN_163726 [Dreissena polymorpha]|uniref:Uncharacterized protein n=1 Tax=Dreissena polymorpha TaxID=45954 RepID=A0A9D4ETX3_DREPO|nr:hypothetical protein DPMN_163726 [Dreissena polymorpha]
MLSGYRSGRYTRFSHRRFGFDSSSSKHVSLVGGHHTGQVGFLPGNPMFLCNKRPYSN